LAIMMGLPQEEVWLAKREVLNMDLKNINDESTMVSSFYIQI
jgi:hypothetical protein